MTSCSQSAESLASFVNDDLDEQAARVVRAHLLVCARCLRVVEDLRAISALAPSLPDPPIPVEEKASLLHAIAKAAEQARQETSQQGADGTRRESASSTGDGSGPKPGC